MKKLLKYIIALAVVFIISMTTTISMLTPNLGGGAGSNLVTEGTNQSQAMGKLLNYFQTLKTFELSGQIEVGFETEQSGQGAEAQKTSNTLSAVSALNSSEGLATDDAVVSFFVQADISNNPKLSADITLTNNGSQANVGIVYAEGKLFLNTDSTKIVVSGESLESAVYLILSSLNVEEFNLESLMAGLDMNKIMASLANMQEQQNEDGTITCNLNIEGIGSADIIMDADYNLKSLEVYDLSFEGLQVNLSADIEKTAECKLDEPEDANEYLDATKLVKSLKNTLSANEIELNTLLSFSDASFSVTAQISILKSTQGFAAKIDLNLNGINASVVYLNGECFVSLENIKVSFNTNDFNTTFKDLLDNLLPQNNQIKNEIIEATTDLTQNLGNQTSNIFENLNINEVLKSIKGLEIGANEVRINVDLNEISNIHLNALASAQIKLSENNDFVENVSLSLNSNDFDFSANLNAASTIETELSVNQNEYLDLAEVYRNLKTLANLSSAKIDFYAQLTQNGKTNTIKTNANLNLKQNQFETLLSLNQNQIGLSFLNNNLYFSGFGVNLNLNSNLLSLGFAELKNIDFNEILNKLSGFSNSIEGPAISDIISKVLQTLNSFKAQNFNLNDVLNKICGNTLNLEDNLNAQEIKDLFANFNLTNLPSVDFNKISEVLSGIRFSGNTISVNLKKGTFGLASDLSFELVIENGNLSLNIQKLEILGTSVQLSLEVKVDPEVNVEVNEEDYLDIYALYTNLKGLQNFSSGEVSANLTLSSNGKTYQTANISAKLSEGYLNAQADFAGAFAKKLSLIQIENNTFVSVDNLNLTFNYNKLKTLLNLEENSNLEQEINNTTVEDVKNIFKNLNLSTYIFENTFESIKTISAKSLLESVSGIKVNSGAIELQLKGSILGQEQTIFVTISLNENQISSINISNLQVSKTDYASINLTFSECEVEPETVDASAYTDVCKIIEQFKNFNLNSLSANVVLKVFEQNSQIYELLSNLDLIVASNSEDDYLNLTLNLGGRHELNANVVLKNNQIYFNVEDILVKLEKQLLCDVFNLENSNLKTLFENLVLNNINFDEIETDNLNFDVYQILGILNEIQISSNKTQVNVTIPAHLLGFENDLTIKVVLNENGFPKQIEVKNLEALEKRFEFTLDFSLNCEIEKVNLQENYFDLQSRYSELVSILGQNNLAFSATLGLTNSAVGQDSSFESFDYTKTLELLLEKESNPEQKLVNLYGFIKATGLLDNINLDVYYQDQVLYISYLSQQGNQPLKIKIDKNNITSSVLAIVNLLYNDAQTTQNINSLLADFHSFLEGQSLDTLFGINFKSLSEVVKLVLNSTFANSTNTTANTTGTQNVNADAQIAGVNIEQILNIIKSITLNESKVEVLYDGIKVNASYSENKLQNVQVLGLSADILSALNIRTDEAFANLDVTFDYTNSSPDAVSDSGYINLNGVDTILSAVENAYNNNASVELSANVDISFQGLDWLVGLIAGGKISPLVNAKINFNSKKGLEMFITISQIPSISILTGSFEDRITTIYYNNNMIYIDRADTTKEWKWGSWGYEYTTTHYLYNCSTDWAFSGANIAYLLQHAIGFTDTITDAIVNALNKVDEEAPAGVIENIIKSFSVSDTEDGSKQFNIGIDGSALTQNTQVGEFVATVIVNNNTIKNVGISMNFVDIITINPLFAVTLNKNPYAFTFNINQNFTFLG